MASASIRHPHEGQKGVLLGEDDAGLAHRAASRLRRWLDEGRGSPPLAVILGGSCNGLSFARSLGRRGIRTLVVDSERALGTYTRFGRVVLLPSADRRPEVWVRFLELVGSRLAEPGVLLPTSDVHTLLVARNAERLGRSFRSLVPDAPVLEQLIDKRSQYELARAAGVPIPSVRFPESLDEAARAADEMSYPCILKPYRSHTARAALAGQKVVLVDSKAELIGSFARISELGVPLMIQEIVPGKDSALFGYLAFWDRDGQERAWVTKRKLRQYPPGYGDGSLQMTVDAPEVAELSRTLLRACGYRGFVGVEFKLDGRDGSYRLMEINPRTVSGNQLAVTAGVDFPWIGYRYLTGVDSGSGAAVHGRSGVRYVNEEWDVQAYLALRRSGEISFGRWIDSVRGVRAVAIGAWDDPGPLLVGLGRLASLAVRTSIARSKGRPGTSP